MASLRGDIMNPTPVWLPAIMNLDGEWANTLSRLYALFTIDFKNSPFLYSGIPVWWDRTIKDNDLYEEGFWHLITKDYNTSGERIPDYDRAKRLPWCKPTIVNSNDPVIKIWNYREGSGKVRTYLWLEHFDYIIILEKRNYRIGDRMFLVTAYHVEGDSTRRKLNNKYNNRIP